MKISNLTKSLKENHTRKNWGAVFDLKKLKISPNAVLWAIFGLVFITELYGLYAFGYKNLVFSTPESSGAKAAVRVNFVNYDKVVKRLSDIQSYFPTSTIDFISPSPNTGRSNPFDDPE